MFIKYHAMTTRIYIHTPAKIFTHTYTHLQKFSRIHIHTCKNLHAYIHTPAKIFTHIYTLARLPKSGAVDEHAHAFFIGQGAACTYRLIYTFALSRMRSQKEQSLTLNRCGG